MGRFASTVAYYERARPPYGPRFFAEVARRLALSGTERLLDLGTGPGILALGFAPWVAELVYDLARGRWGEPGSPARHALDRSAFLAGTRFRSRGTVSVEFGQDITVTALVDRVLSMSTSSPDRIGGDVAVLRASIGTALDPFAKDGILHEIVEARAEVFAAVD